MEKNAIENEVRQRAELHLTQPVLVVDYYRIRRRLAYLLPIRNLPEVAMQIPGIPVYPWETWMSWQLEERMYSLGWAGHWFQDTVMRDMTTRDVSALARWPLFPPQPSLCTAHVSRTLWTAFTQWPWLGNKARADIEGAFHRMLKEGLPFVENKYGVFSSHTDILALANPSGVLPNVPIISLIGLALAAEALKHASAPRLHQLVRMVLNALFECRSRGFSEGLAYDGYVLDFVADWLKSLPTDEDRIPILQAPQAQCTLDEAFQLAAPGHMLQVAELSDVEPQMIFHASAHAKWCRMQGLPTSGWYLNRCPMERVRTDALAALHEITETGAVSAPEPGAIDAHYAMVLRSGWEPDDLAVAMAASNSSMGHIHRDNGSIVIGAKGQWLLTDPGYQQYMSTSERNFTLGTTAHNAPVINEQAQTRKASRRLALKQEAPRRYRAALDLTACYAAEIPLTSVIRTVWLAEKNLVVVMDQIESPILPRLTYHWHGHADAAWCFQGEWAGIHGAGTTLWLTALGSPIHAANLSRLRGSRGSLTIKADADVNAKIVWWIFGLGHVPPAVQGQAGDKLIHVANQAFGVD